MLGRFVTSTPLSSTLAPNLSSTRSALNSSSCRLSRPNPFKSQELLHIRRCLSFCSERTVDEKLLHDVQFPRFGIQGRDRNRKDSSISHELIPPGYPGSFRTTNDSSANYTSSTTFYEVVQAVRLATEIHTYSTIAGEAKESGQRSHYIDAFGNIEASMPPLRSLMRSARRNIKSANWKDPENCAALHALIQLHVENMNYSPAASETSALSSVYAPSKTRDTFLQHISPALKEVLDSDAWPGFAIAELATIPDMHSLFRPYVLVSMACSALRQKEWLTVQEIAYLLRTLCKPLPPEYIAKYNDELQAEFERPLSVGHTSTVQLSDFSALQALMAAELGTQLYLLLQNPECMSLLHFDDIGELCDLASVYKGIIHTYEPYFAAVIPSAEASNTTPADMVPLARDVLLAISSATLRILQNSLEATPSSTPSTHNSAPLAYSSFVPPSPVTGGVSAQLAQTIAHENEPSALVRSSQGWSKSLWASGWKAATNPYNRVYQYFEGTSKGDSNFTSVNSNASDTDNRTSYDFSSEANAMNQSTRAKNIHTFTPYHPATMASLFQLLLTLASTQTLTPNLLFEACTLWEREWRRQFFYFSPPPTVHTALLLSSTLRFFTSSEAVEHLRALAIDQDHYLNFDLFHLQANMKYRPARIQPEDHSSSHEKYPLQKGYFASVRDSSRWMTALPTPSDKSYSTIVSKAAEVVWRDMQSKVRTASSQSLAPEVPAYMAYSLAPSALRTTQKLFRDEPLVVQYLSPEGVVVDVAFPELMLGIIALRPDDLQPIPQCLASETVQTDNNADVRNPFLPPNMMYTPEFQLQCDVLASAGWNILYIPHDALTVHTRQGLVNHLSAFSIPSAESQKSKSSKAGAATPASAHHPSAGIMRRAMEELVDLALAQRNCSPLGPLWSTLRTTPHVFLAPKRPERNQRTIRFSKEKSMRVDTPRRRKDEDAPLTEVSTPATPTNVPDSTSTRYNHTDVDHQVDAKLETESAKVAETEHGDSKSQPPKLEDPNSASSSERISRLAQTLRLKSTQISPTLKDSLVVQSTPSKSPNDAVLDASMRYGTKYWSRMLASLNPSK